MQTRDKFDSALRSITMSAKDATRSQVAIIDVGALLDYRAAEQMKRRFKQFAADGRHRHIVDLSETSALDSAGLAGLISALRAVRDNGGSVDLVVTSGNVSRILELTSVTRAFKVHPSLQEALAAV
jgi:anti-sigma B factor antagonist